MAIEQNVLPSYIGWKPSTNGLEKGEDADAENHIAATENARLVIMNATDQEQPVIMNAHSEEQEPDEVSLRA